MPSNQLSTVRLGLIISWLISGSYPDAITDGVVGMGHHAFTFFEAGDDLRTQSPPLTDIDHALPGPAVFLNIDGPSCARAEKGRGGNPEDILALLDHKAGLNTVTVAKGTPCLRR